MTATADHREDQGDDVTPEQAYRNAPADLLREAMLLLRTSTEHTVRTLAGDPPDDEAERAFLLRRAALSDRTLLAWPQQEFAQRDAAELAALLVRFDQQHPHLVPVGIRVPDDIENLTAGLLHVRRCYDADVWA